jgi:hypothetical protein
MLDALLRLIDALLNPRLLAFIMGAAGTLGSLFALGKTRLSLYWPKTRGKIVASLVDVTYDRYGRQEEPEIAYQYTVDGRTFNRSSINAGGDTSWSLSVPGISSAQGTVDEYPVDREVDVYYWPRFPGVACLKPGGGTAATVVVLVIALAFLWGSLFVGRHRAHAPHPVADPNWGTQP